MGKRRKNAYENGGVKLGKSDGWWVADWRDAGTRKRTRLIEATSPEKEARERLDGFAEARRAVSKQRASHSVGKLWELWLEDRSRDGFDNAIYAHQWKALAPRFASRDPDLITRQDCRDYAKERFAAGRAPSTVHTELARLRSCLHWAHEERLIGPPPKIWLPQAGKPRDRVLSPPEAIRLLDGARRGDPHVFVFVVLLFLTGGRHKAVLDLTWDRVDFDAGLIELDELLPPDPMVKAWRKGRAEVAMSDLARTVLQTAHAGRQTSHVVEHGGKRLKDCREGFAAAVRRAELGWMETREDGSEVWTTDVTPHTIRHTVATWLDKAVRTAETAQLLGHSDEATTRRIYTHASAENTRRAVSIIEGNLTDKDDGSVSGRNAKEG